MKPPTANDPMELVGVALPQGDLERMAECLVEEYLLLGWSKRQILSLFSRNCFRATHRIHMEKGEAYVAALIDRIAAEWRPTGEMGGQADA
jgi:hypothetical protein